MRFAMLDSAMKVQRNKSCRARLRRYELSWRGEALRLETNGLRATIRAAEDTFLPGQKAALVRYLVEEGFIPNHCGKPIAKGSGNYPGLEWVIKAAPQATARRNSRVADGFMLCLLGGALAAWLVEMLALLLTAKR